MSLCASVYMCFGVTCWERADLFALVCGVYYEFVTFPLLFWVRCGTWLYRFLIFAPLLTLLIIHGSNSDQDIRQNHWNLGYYLNGSFGSALHVSPLSVNTVLFTVTGAISPVIVNVYTNGSVYTNGCYSAGQVLCMGCCTWRSHSILTSTLYQFNLF